MLLGIPSVGQLWRDLRGVPIVTDLQSYRKTVASINARGPALVSLDDAALAERAQAARTQLRAAAIGADGDRRDTRAAEAKALVEVFALVRELATRRLGLRPYDEQLIAGLALHAGAVAEMATGEGKTLAAVAPVVLAALGGAGVHVLTFNDYLARRDAAWMGPVYDAFGLRVGVIQQGMPTEARRLAYRADVTYATAREAGFDLLRDQRAESARDRVQRGHHAALVDEADSILIDEARIPLVIAGREQDGGIDPARLDRIARQLSPGEHVDTDDEGRTVFLTPAGVDLAEELLGCGPLYDEANRGLLAGLNVALHAHTLLRRDVDYIVRDGKVELVDEFTGRVVEQRRWPDGLQPALQAKERLAVEPDGVVLGSITLQHYLTHYARLAGMTATAQPAATEFAEFYGLRTVVVPPHRPCVRRDEADAVFSHREAKERALRDEIARAHGAGRPVLVGTASVAESERLAAALVDAGVACRVLNARNDEAEAAIVADAGAPGAVTISTNMAGRGTDIRLGGADGAARDAVVAAGGLYVIGTNRHESRRIDDQLRGRSGRQGDPGSSRFWVSLDDDLMQRFGVLGLIPARHRPERVDAPVDDPVVHREIDRTQRIVEGQNFEVRKTLWRYSSVVERQRQVMRAARDRVIDADEALQLLEQRDPVAVDALRERVGEAAVRAAARRVGLDRLDRAWCEQLARIADVREGIHLRGLATANPFGIRRGPLEQFEREVTASFDELLDEVAEQTVAGFAELEVVDGAIRFERAGLRGPGATWTYLVNDDPFESALGQLIRSAQRALERG